MVCPDTEETLLLYTGTTVGSHYTQAGSAEYLCLHDKPQFLQTTAGIQTQRSQLYGTEYESHAAFSNIFRHDAPCSVCYTPTRHTKIIIPGRISCPPSWTREYYGYYMTSGYFADQKNKVPVCVDVQAESIPGSSAHTVTSLLYFMETTCTGIRCPPYSNGAEITCVVCTK